MTTTVKESDLIRIERTSGQGALTIEAEYVVALHDVFRHMFIEEDWDFSLFDTEGEGGEKLWECTAGNQGAEGDSPWLAIVELARKLR